MRKIYFTVVLFLSVISPRLYSQELKEKIADSSVSSVVKTDERDHNFSIVVQNFYYPKAGNEDEVMKWRQRASAIRAQLGLAVGRILKRVSESTSQPYIVWECEYSSLQAREEDVAQLDKSDEFKKVQDHMSTLLEKFDRSVWQIVK